MSEAVTHETALSRAEQRRSPLYAGRVEVYARSVRGFYRNVKWAALVVLLGIYYLVPWIRWDRGPGHPDQAVLVDMANARLYFFWIEIWPQEVYFLTGLLILGAFGLFLATAAYGRLWCGFACPQTVWTDLFMAVERWFEGDRNERMRLDQQPWTAAKWRKRIGKHAVWILIAAATGGAWIMYFGDAPTMLHELATLQASFAVYFFFGLFTFTTYLLAGHAREQVCTYMCPWPRIQGALVDQDTRAVTYEKWRGEPRGKHKKGDPWDGRGDCVDCKACVSVCPTGIDIRDGFQLECIGCGLCIDACDEVMTKVERPTGLISYDSERNQELRACGRPAQNRLIRPRTLLYAGVLLIVATVMLVALMLRNDTEMNILPERSPLFVMLSDGSVRNGYTLRIMNKDVAPRSYRLSVDGPDDAVLSVPSHPTTSRSVTLDAPGDGVGTHRVFVRIPRDEIDDEAIDLAFVVTDVATGQSRRFKTIFRGPKKHGRDSD